MNKIVFWPRINLARARLETALGLLGHARLVVVHSLQEVLNELPDAVGLVLPDAPVEQARKVVEALVEPGCTLRWMHFITAGRNGFDAAGLPATIAVTGAAGAVAPTVAEHAFALLLAMARRIPDMAFSQRRNEWDLALSRRVSSLEGKRMLIVGLGPIGLEVAKRATAFGMQVEAVTRTPRDVFGIGTVYPLSLLNERLGLADAIVLCLPLTAQTRHIIDQTRLALLRPSAWLINVGRGGLIDHDALAESLSSDRLAGAGLDVTDPEPLPREHPLWQCERALISPHIAGAGSEASEQRVAQGAMDSYAALFGGTDVKHD